MAKKYIDAEKLKEEIQPLYENANKRAHLATQTGTSSDCAKYDEAKYIYEHIFWFIDALQQKQPEVDLKKEYKEYVEDDPVFSKLTNRNVGLSIARHFYELGRNARKK